MCGSYSNSPVASGSIILTFAPYFVPLICAYFRMEDWRAVRRRGQIDRGAREDTCNIHPSIRRARRSLSCQTFPPRYVPMVSLISFPGGRRLHRTKNAAMQWDFPKRLPRNRDCIVKKHLLSIFFRIYPLRDKGRCKFLLTALAELVHPARK